MQPQDQLKSAANFAASIFQQAQRENVPEDILLTALAIAQYAAIRSISETHGIEVTQASMQAMLEEHAAYTNRLANALMEKLETPQLSKGVNHG